MQICISCNIAIGKSSILLTQHEYAIARVGGLIWFCGIFIYVSIKYRIDIRIGCYSQLGYKLNAVEVFLKNAFHPVMKRKRKE